MLADDSDDVREQHARGGLRFFLVGENGEPFRPSRCWVKREPGTSLDDWSLHLERPEGDTVVINDLKQWLLFQTQEYRHFEYDKTTPQADLRCYRREAVLEKYLRALLGALPAPETHGPVWCLIPSIGDTARRKRYRDAIKRALPGARFLPEPEMVIEYFRLVRRELTLEDHKSSVYLVIDAGASTCNFTFVLTRKDQKVTGAHTGVARKGSLRAKQGEAAEAAGRWVDEELGRLLGVHHDLWALTPAVRADAMRAIEAAKLSATRTRTTAMIEHTALPRGLAVDRELLKQAAENLWVRLTPTYRAVAEQFLADVQRGADGGYFRERLETHGIKDAGGVQHLIDGVILAGGTSQLPGFKAAMMRHLFDEAAGVKLHTVGDDYSIAAATGALAHVLHQHHRPSRLHAAAGVDSADSLATATFEGTPITDIFLAWKREDEQEQKLLVLDRDAPPVGAHDLRPIEGMPAFDVGDKIDARLIPGDEYSFRGRGLHSLVVTRAPGRMSLDWNAGLLEAKVVSTEVRGTNALHLALASLWPDPLHTPAVTEPQRPGVRLWTDGASDVIIDLGMSKTVMVSADPGPFVTPFGPGSAVPGSWTEPGDLGTPRSLDRFEPLPVAAVAAARPAVPPTERPALSQFRIPAARPPSAPVLTLVRDPMPEAELGPSLAEALATLIDAKQHAAVADLTLLLLALAVRPFVLLAGPPGSGKSTLVRQVARLLGLEEGQAFFEVTVQPHWRTEKAVPRDARRAWEENEGRERRLFLFDELNLARPESYLMPFYRRLDAQGPGGPLLACGTLNIDDTSRPPSPKVIDRCFLLEIDAPTGTVVANASHGVWPSGTISSLPEITGGAQELHPDIAETIGVFRRRDAGGMLRQDLLPSRRDEADLVSLLAAYQSGKIPSDLLPESDLIDRAIAGRLLVKLAGSAEQVRPLIDDLDRHFEKYPAFKRCRRKIALAKQQLELGFVSPWQ